MAATTQDATALLVAWGNGDQAAFDALMPLVHDELHQIARRQMAGERRGHTLQATALVNEAYLRLIEVKRMHWQNRAHFFAMAARVMRRILVNAALARGYQKRGGGAARVTLDEGLAVSPEIAPDVVALDGALTRLAMIEPRKAQVVELRFFGGFEESQVAEVLGVSAITVKRDWKAARAWLAGQLSPANRTPRF